MVVGTVELFKGLSAVCMGIRTKRKRWQQNVTNECVVFSLYMVTLVSLYCYTVNFGLCRHCESGSDAWALHTTCVNYPDLQSLLKP